MNINDAVREGGEQLWLDDAHEPGEHHSIDSCRLEHFDAAVLGRALKLGFERGTVEIFGADRMLRRAFENFRIGEVGEYKFYLGVERSRFDRVNNRLHVRAGAGTENAEIQFSHLQNPFMMNERR